MKKIIVYLLMAVSSCTPVKKVQQSATPGMTIRF